MKELREEGEKTDAMLEEYALIVKESVKHSKKLLRKVFLAMGHPWKATVAEAVMLAFSKNRSQVWSSMGRD